MMQPLKAHHSVVLAGAWNPHIFLPGWVGPNLASEAIIEVAVALNNRELPLRYQIDGVYLHVGQQKLQFNPVDLEAQTLAKTAALAIKVLGLLSHTPLTGVGVNFGYRGTEGTEVDRGAFDGTDLSSLSGLDATVVSTEVQRVISIEGVLLRYKLGAPTSGASMLRVNFHRDTVKTIEAVEHLSVGMEKYQSLSMKVANGLYRIEGE